MYCTVLVYIRSAAPSSVIITNNADLDSVGSAFFIPDSDPVLSFCENQIEKRLILSIFRTVHRNELNCLYVNSFKVLH